MREVLCGPIKVRDGLVEQDHDEAPPPVEPGLVGDETRFAESDAHKTDESGGEVQSNKGTNRNDCVPLDRLAIEEVVETGRETLRRLHRIILAVSRGQ